MKYTILNVTLALSSTFLLTILLHEAAHYLTAHAFGFSATLFHNRVHSQLDDALLSQLLFAGIAPLFSLALGVTCYLIGRKGPPTQGRLFVYFFGLAGIISFCGYLLIGPLIPLGDTGKVLRLLGVPMLVQIALAVASIAVLTVFLIRATPRLEQFSSGKAAPPKVARKQAALSLVLFPLLLSILIVSILQLPVPHFASILATTCAPLSMMAIFGSMLSNSAPLPIVAPAAQPLHQQTSWLLAGLFLAGVVLNRLLVMGF